MLTLRKFVQAIQQSVESVTQTLQQQNTDFIKTYFDVIDKPRDDVFHIGKRKKKSNDTGDEEPDTVEVLIPKMVPMEYPSLLPDGSPSHHLVHVPLISLAPHSLLQIEDMTFRIDMDVYEDTIVTDENGNEEVQDLKVSFPSKGAKKSFRIFGQEKETAKATNVEITITMREIGQPDGLKIIIEGYDKALRAQVPN